jgi:hypothetical protein
MAVDLNSDAAFNQPLPSCCNLHQLNSLTRYGTESERLQIADGVNVAVDPLRLGMVPTFSDDHKKSRKVSRTRSERYR